MSLSRRDVLALALLALAAQARAATVPPGCVRVSGEEGNGTDVYIGTTDAGEAIWCAAGSATAPGGYGSTPAAPAGSGHGQSGYDPGGGYAQGGYGSTAPQASGWGGQGSGQAGSSGGYGAAAGGYGAGGYGGAAGGYGGSANAGGFQGGSFGNKGSNVGGGANPYASGKTFEKREKGWKNKPPAGSTAGAAGYGAAPDAGAYGNAGTGYGGGAAPSGDDGLGGGAPSSSDYDSGYGQGGPSSSQDNGPAQSAAPTMPDGDAASGYGGSSDGGQGYGSSTGMGYGSEPQIAPEPGASNSGKPLVIDADRLRGTRAIDRSQLGGAKRIDPDAVKKASVPAAADGSSSDSKPLPKLNYPLPPAEPAPTATLPQQAIDPATVDPQTLKNVSANPDAAIKAGAAAKFAAPAAQEPAPVGGSKPKPKSIRSKKPDGG